MRFIIAAMLATATTVTAMPAQAQSGREYRQEVQEARRDYQRDLRRADSRGDVRQAQREYRRDVRDARQDYRRDARNDWRNDRNQWGRYDYNRAPPGQRGYYADNFYRDGRYYQTRRLSRNDRVYRGSNGRYYCRRNDGTTGLIIGGLGGGVLGSLLANGSSNTLGALIGAGAGALLGSQVDRGNVNCR